MTLVKCLYCDAENDALATHGYCDSCGKKLPNSAMIHTRRVLAAQGDDEVSEAVGPARGVGGRTAEALAVTAVVYLVAAGLFMILGPYLFARVPPNFLSLVLAWGMLPAVVVGGLMVWARRAPRAATLAGLVAALAWVGSTFAIDSEFAVRWLIVQAVLLALLAHSAWVTRG